MHQWELRGRLDQERVEGIGVDERGVAVGDGRDAHQRLELGDRTAADGLEVGVAQGRWRNLLRPAPAVDDF